MIIRRKKELDGSIYFQIEANEDEFKVLVDAAEEYFNSVSIGTLQRLDVATVINEFLKAVQERGM